MGRQDHAAFREAGPLQADVETFVRPFLSQPVRPFHHGDPLPVEEVLHPQVPKRPEGPQSVEVHVVERVPPFIFVDEGEGGAGDPTIFHAESPGDPLRETGFPAPQFPVEADHVPRFQPSPQGGPKIPGRLRSVGDAQEGFHGQDHSPSGPRAMARMISFFPTIPTSRVSRSTGRWWTSLSTIRAAISSRGVFSSMVRGFGE